MVDELARINNRKPLREISYPVGIPPSPSSFPSSSNQICPSPPLFAGTSSNYKRDYTNCNTMMDMGFMIKDDSDEGSTVNGDDGSHDDDYDDHQYYVEDDIQDDVLVDDDDDSVKGSDNSCLSINSQDSTTSPRLSEGDSHEYLTYRSRLDAIPLMSNSPPCCTVESLSNKHDSLLYTSPPISHRVDYDSPLQYPKSRSPPAYGDGYHSPLYTALGSLSYSTMSPQSHYGDPPSLLQPPIEASVTGSPSSTSNPPAYYTKKYMEMHCTSRIRKQTAKRPSNGMQSPSKKPRSSYMERTDKFESTHVGKKNGSREGNYPPSKRSAWSEPCPKSPLPHKSRRNYDSTRERRHNNREVIKRRHSSDYETSSRKRPKYFDKEAIDEFTWDMNEMKLVASRDAYQIIRDSYVVTKVSTFIRSCRACLNMPPMAILLKILLNCLDCGTRGAEFIEDLEIFSEECVPFWGGLSIITRGLPQCKDIDAYNLTNLLCKFSTILIDEKRSSLNTKIFSLLPLDELHEALKQLSDIDTAYANDVDCIAQLVDTRNAWRSSSSSLPIIFKQLGTSDNERSFICDFILTSENLNYNGYSSKLKKNIVKGKFSSSLEYLKIHYELLQEDFLYPLRTALHNVRCSTKSELNRKRNDCNYYKNVKLAGKDVSNCALVYKMNFEFPTSKKPHRRKINWEQNKLFTFGSLVCLSNDAFHTKIFASVAERKSSDLQKNIISVRLIDSVNSQAIQPKEVYEMIESPSYLEACAPVLARINTLMKNPREMVFKDYFVSYDPSVKVSLPQYMTFEDKSRQLNLRTIVCGCKKMSQCTHHEYSTVDVTDGEFWSNLESPVLDESQKEALKLALTHEVALIQGPPGTGKTFIGLKLVEILLRNRKMYSSSASHQPLVIMCYTNHALDQFLEGILNLRTSQGISLDMVRVGGRSKSEALKEFALYKKLIAARREQKSQKKQRRYLVRENLPRIQAQCDALEDLCNSKDYCSVNEMIYFSFLHPEEIMKSSFDYLRDAMQNHRPDVRDILNWFHIKEKPAKQNERKNGRYQKESKDYTEYQAVEDDRNDNRADHRSNGSIILDIADNRRDLTRLFRDIQNCQPIMHRLNRRLQLQHKLDIFKYCLKIRLSELEDAKSKLMIKKQQIDEDEQRLTISVLKKADIIGLTTTGAAKNNHILTGVRAKIVIVEEAAEIVEAHIISALTSHTQHLVMIGDHNQLRPKVNDYRIGNEYKLEISLFERLIMNEFPYKTLQEQHRMRPEISQLIHPHIYNELIDHKSVHDFPAIKGMAENIFFISHSQPEEEDEGLSVSHSNTHEASFMASLCQYILQQGYEPSVITVLTPYTGQVFCLKRYFRESKITNEVRILPIDQYQGEENDIILLSLVRSKKAGFVKESNRICVALSRAKHGFYCIGNFNMFEESSELWENILKSVHQRNLIGTQLTLKCQPHIKVNHVSKASDFEAVSEGGCSEICNIRRDCGHICDRMCHPYSINLPHPGECTKPCARKCPNDLHQCKLKCSEECKCDVKVMKKIPNCNHTQEMRCDVEPSDHECQEPCEKILACGHTCRAKCGEPCKLDCEVYINGELPCGHKAQRKCCENEVERMKKCSVKCHEELDCGHKCSGECGKCHQGRLHVLCKEKCKRVLPLCGHMCPELCSKVCPPCKKMCPLSCSHGNCGHVCGIKLCISCTEPCQWNCSHHKCHKRCGEICDRPRCDKPCIKLLRGCRHKCMGLCQEECPDICKKCDPKNEAFEIFFGNEDDDDARFIKLRDCGHSIEYKALDMYMDSTDDAIGLKKCPRCAKLIQHPPMRYCNNIKQLKQSINQIKGKRANMFSKEERKKLIEEIIEMSKKVGDYFKKNFKTDSLYSYDNHQIQKHHIILTALILDCTKAKEIVESIAGLSNPSNGCISVDELRKEFKRVEFQLACLHSTVKRQQIRAINHLPVQALNDIQRERQRLSLLLQLYELLANVLKQCVILSAQDEVFLNVVRVEANPRNFKSIFETSKAEKYIQVLKRICKEYEISGISAEEKAVIMKAVNSKGGSWYRCPNGHLYNIGQCGGAMEIGNCPECNELIGGTDHKLLKSNDMMT